MQAPKKGGKDESTIPEDQPTDDGETKKGGKKPKTGKGTTPTDMGGKGETPPTGMTPPDGMKPPIGPPPGVSPPVGPPNGMPPIEMTPPPPPPVIFELVPPKPTFLILKLKPIETMPPPKAKKEDKFKALLEMLRTQLQQSQMPPANAPAGGGSGSSGSAPAVSDAPAVAPQSSEQQAAPAKAGFDLELIDVRLVDAGDVAKKIGPRYRVFIRNNSTVPVKQEFNVALYASKDRELKANLPNKVERISDLKAGETVAIDIRLPFEVFRLGQTEDGRPLEFSQLFVFVDSDNEIVETDKENNAALLPRDKILKVAAKTAE